MNRGNIVNIKNHRIIRLLSLNPNGLKSNNSKKIEHFIQKSIELKIDIALLSAIDTKQNEYTTSSMKNKMRAIYDKLEMIVIDSKDHKCTKNNYLPGGTASLWQSSIESYINPEHICKDNL